MSVPSLPLPGEQSSFPGSPETSSDFAWKKLKKCGGFLSFFLSQAELPVCF
jgi:hypothetical protein